MAARTRKRPTQTAAERLSARDCDIVGFLVAEFKRAPKLRAAEIRAEVAQQPIPTDLSGVTEAEAAAAYMALINGS